MQDEKEKRNRKSESFKIVHCFIWEVPGAKFYFVFCGFYITIGLHSDSEPKDFHNHDGSHSLKKTDVLKILLSKWVWD